MRLVIAGVSPYGACKRVGIATNTMYRSRLYKMWKEAVPLELVDKQGYNKIMLELHRELDMSRPIPRVSKKEKFIAKLAKETPDDGRKICSRCKESKPSDQFYKRPGGVYLHSACKLCDAEMRKESPVKDKKKQRFTPKAK